MDDLSSALGGISIGFIIFCVITAIIFLICREIVCWYFKINKSIEKQDKEIDLLKTIIETQRQQLEYLAAIAEREDNRHEYATQQTYLPQLATDNALPEKTSTPAKRFCTKCGSELKPGSKFCTTCGQQC